MKSKGPYRMNIPEDDQICKILTSCSTLFHVSSASNRDKQLTPNQGTKDMHPHRGRMALNSFR